jgi:anti-sigma B factor antagonist
MEQPMGDFPMPPSGTALTSSTTPEGAHRLRIAFSGEIDLSTADQVADIVRSAMRQHQPRELNVDLAGVRFMDSSGIHALMRCHAHAGESGCRLVVVDPHPTVYRVLQVTELLDFFGMPAEGRDRSGNDTEVVGAPVEG